MKESQKKALEAMREASRIAEENGIADMTLDEINAEIAEARKERDTRMEAQKGSP